MHWLCSTPQKHYCSAADTHFVDTMVLLYICVQEILSLGMNGNIGYPEGNHSILLSMSTTKILLKLARLSCFRLLLLYYG
jgi:hypothetical protein